MTSGPILKTLAAASFAAFTAAQAGPAADADIDAALRNALSRSDLERALTDETPKAQTPAVRPVNPAQAPLTTLPYTIKLAPEPKPPATQTVGAAPQTPAPVAKADAPASATASPFDKRPIPTFPIAMTDQSLVTKAPDARNDESGLSFGQGLALAFGTIVSGVALVAMFAGGNRANPGSPESRAAPSEAPRPAPSRPDPVRPAPSPARSASEPSASRRRSVLNTPSSTGPDSPNFTTVALGSTYDDTARVSGGCASDPSPSFGSGGGGNYGGGGASGSWGGSDSGSCGSDGGGSCGGDGGGGGGCDISDAQQVRQSVPGGPTVLMP